MKAIGYKAKILSALGSGFWALGPAYAEDIRDVKGPMDWPASFVWLWIVLGALLVLGMVWFVRRLRDKKGGSNKIVELPKNPWETAYERLEFLRQKNLPASGKYKEYYVELSDITRRYMEDRFDIKAPEMTTEEFLNLLKNSSDLTLEHKAALKDFLNACDMVKFAKYGPTVSEAEQSFILAQRLVDGTKSVEGILEVSSK